jgi:hypothetical protein
VLHGSAGSSWEWLETIDFAWNAWRMKKAARGGDFSSNSLILLVAGEGFEPPTLGL